VAFTRFTSDRCSCWRVLAMRSERVDRRTANPSTPSESAATSVMLIARRSRRLMRQQVGGRCSRCRGGVGRQLVLAVSKWVMPVSSPRSRTRPPTTRCSGAQPSLRRPLPLIVRSVRARCRMLSGYSPNDPCNCGWARWVSNPRPRERLTLPFKRHSSPFVQTGCVERTDPIGNAMRQGLRRCFVAAVLFGCSTPAASHLAGGLNAFMLAGLLYVGAAIAVAPVAVRSWPSKDAWRNGWRRLTIAVVFGGAVGPVLLAVGLRRVSASTVSLLLNLELVFTTILAIVVFREHLGRRMFAGTALVVVGGSLAGWSSDAGLRWGALLVAGACLCWAIDNSVTANLDQLAPAVITLTKGLIAGGANLAIGLATGSGAMFGWRVPAALVVGAIGYGVSITLWIAGARELGAARGQLVFAIAPFVGVVVSWTVLGDPVVGRVVVALVLALIGLSFVLHSAHVHEHEHSVLEHEHAHTHDDGHHVHDHPSIGGRHAHRHIHDPMVHSHVHVPDVHHRHDPA
jgi:drug/metabolite transporter (DMT)-like permease